MGLELVKKMKIVTEYDSGKSLRTIAQEMDINVKTVYRWVKRFSENKSFLRKRGSGLHKKNLD